ncbi:MAG TPA: ABC transporter permease, partial [Vicinamibacterales bacterium]|nr:ABC transporter permease [Vicinamibacterales bacterium]
MAPRPHRRERRWFRRLVALLPFDTRRDYGHAMEQDFLLEYGDRAIQGRGAIGRLWLETIAGLFAFARRDQWTATKDDLRQTLRGWRRSPALSLVLLATMAAGITGVVVAFAVIDAVVLRPLPVPDPPTLVRVGERHEQNPQLSNVTYATFLDLEERSGSLTSLAASRFAFLNLTGEGTPERLLGAQVSGAFFDALGVPPVTGRLLTRDDDRDGEDAVAVISERLWRSRFGGEESTVGRRVRLNNTVREIVGILPAGAAYPLGTDVWVPLVARGSGLESNRRFHGLLVIGRIGPAATGAAVRAELGTIASSINTAEPEADPDLDLGLESVLERTVAPVRPALWTTLAATLLLLVVLGTNVAHVQLARAAAREREFALRSALGASRGRLARLLLTESVALALVAGGIGIGVAWLAVGSLPAWLPTTLPRAEAIGFDWRAAAAGLAVALVVGLGVGGWPAVRTAAPGALGGVRIVGGSGTGVRRLPGRVLASLQLALTFALVVIAGLVVR